MLPHLVAHHLQSCTFYNVACPVCACELHRREFEAHCLKAHHRATVSLSGIAAGHRTSSHVGVRASAYSSALHPWYTPLGVTAASILCPQCRSAQALEQPDDEGLLIFQITPRHACIGASVRCDESGEFECFPPDLYRRCQQERQPLLAHGAITAGAPAVRAHAASVPMSELLPSELLVLVLCFLDVRMLKVAMRTCKYWRRSVQSHWRALYLAVWTPPHDTAPDEVTSRMRR